MDERHVERIRAQFTRQAEVYARMRQTTDQRGLDGLVRLSGAGPADHVLDVACGPGFLTMTFAAHAARAIGCDATEAFLALARVEAARRRLGNVVFTGGDVAALPFADASFDVVACRAAFHHFPQPGRVLAEMRRVVRPGGRLVVADMLGAEDAARAAYHDRMERLCDPTHVRALPESELRRLFGDAALELHHARRSEADITVDEWIAHGGPSSEAAREARALMEASLDADRCGLRVRQEDGRVVFSHQVGAFVLLRPA
jgi:ubiquinone/menaquinone biosynthesis C-methylase UbiE